MKNNEIEKTLDSLDNIQRAQAPKDFKENLLRKIRQGQKVLDPWYPRLKYGIAAMITLAIINGYILFRSDLITSQEKTTVELLASEWYSEFDIIEYDYENK